MQVNKLKYCSVSWAAVNCLIQTKLVLSHLNLVQSIGNVLSSLPWFVAD